MKTVDVNPGICGFTARIVAVTQGDGRVRVCIESQCELVREFAARLPTVDPLDVIRSPEALGEHRCHGTCIVPLAVLKAVEAEGGLALPRDVAIRFVEPPDA